MLRDLPPHLALPKCRAGVFSHRVCARANVCMCWASKVLIDGGVLYKMEGESRMESEAVGCDDPLLMENLGAPAKIATSDVVQSDLTVWEASAGAGWAGRFLRIFLPPPPSSGAPLAQCARSAGAVQLFGRLALLETHTL